MKFTFVSLTLSLFFSSVVFSQEQELREDKQETPKIVLDDILLYDGDLSKERFYAPWIRQDHVYGKIDYTYAVNCGHLKVALAKHVDWGWATLEGHESYSCFATVVGFDFTNSGLLVLVDLAKQLKKKSDQRHEFYPVARYLARLTGNATDFFSEVRSKKKGGTKLANLGEVMNYLSRSINGVGQERFMDGMLKIERKGQMKWDPHNIGFEFPTDRQKFDRRFLLTEDDIVLNLISGSEDHKRYSKPEPVFAALKDTMRILSEGYKTLQQSSEENVKDDFKDFIVENAGVISRDLKNAIKLTRRKSYHPMELIHFVNQISDLIEACDDILESKLGSNPDFITILNNQSENN